MPIYLDVEWAPAHPTNKRCADTASVVIQRTCPLCNSHQTSLFHADNLREYFRCATCDLTFVPADWHLGVEQEKSVYDQHENSPDDEAYRNFLNRVFAPLCEKLPPQSRGLDFGSGPGPTLSVMFAEAGHTVAIYDPFYAPATSPLNQQYEFVTATEVVEHLRQPRMDLDRMWSCVRPGGLLGIMTKRTHDLDAFVKWHYINDPTHVSFFSEETFAWLAADWNAKVEIVGPDVVIFTKPAAGHA